MKVYPLRRLIALGLLSLATVACTSTAPKTSQDPASTTTPAASTSAAETPAAATGEKLPELAQAWTIVNFGAPW